MNRHYDKYLSNKYEILYRDRHASMQQTCMCWGFDCGDGWFDLINALSFQLEMLNHVLNITITASQVKQKYGTLRFYYSVDFSTLKGALNEKQLCRQWLRVIDNLVHQAEIASYHICEACGSWADKQTKGYIETLCDKHYKEALDARS